MNPKRFLFIENCVLNGEKEEMILIKRGNACVKKILGEFLQRLG